MNSEIYLPLSSNTAWFESEDTLSCLERYLKSSVVIFDKLKLQDGRLHLSAGNDGQGMTFHYLKDAYPGNRTEYKPYKQGSPFGVAIGGRGIMQSTTAFSVDVDFMPLAAKAGITNAAYVEWVSYALRQPISTRLEAAARTEIDCGAYDACLPENRYLRSQLLQCYYKDALLAYNLQLPMLIDPSIAPLAFAIADGAGTTLRKTFHDSAFHAWKALDLPDFAEWEWDEILKFRESAKGVTDDPLVSRRVLAVCSL